MRKAASFLAGMCLLLVFGAAWPTSQRAKLCDDDNDYCADVSRSAGVNRLETSSIVTVQSTFGLDPQGTDFFFFGGTLEDANGIGSAGDTVRVEIPAAVTPIGTTLYPAVDYTYTVTASDVANDNPEREVAENVCVGLNADTNFILANWKCDVAKDFGYVHIASRLMNEWGTRSSWTVTCSGLTICTIANGSIVRRSKAAELARSPNDPGRLGFFGITGTVLSIPGGLGKRFFEFFYNTETIPSKDMRQDCDEASYTENKCRYTVPVDNNEDLFISQIRCYGGCSGIKFGQFLCKNQPLGSQSRGSGISVEIKSDNEITTLPGILTTEDFKNYFSFPQPGNAFRIDVQAGEDQFVATFAPELSFIIRKSGTYGIGNDDYIHIHIYDDISSGLAQLECLAEGFRQE